MQSTLSETDLAIVANDELYHHGIKGMSWGNRRWQYGDGSLTPEGRIHYGVGEARDKLSAMSKEFISKYNNVKIDTLDVLNRKGVLNFLDSKASDPFEAIESGVATGNGRFKTTAAGQDIFRALSNTERYNTIAKATSDLKFDRRKDYLLSNGVSEDEVRDNYWKTRLSASKSYNTMLKDYTDKNMQGVVNGLLNKEGQSVYDKTLGMKSKDARDMHRESKALNFIDSIKTNGEYDVSKFSDEWYKTNYKGYTKSFQEATGKTGNIYETREHTAPTYKSKITEVEPDEKWSHDFIFQNKLGGDAGKTEHVYEGTHKTWVSKFDENGIAREHHEGVYKGETKTAGYFDKNDITTKTIDKMLVGKTKEYMDYMNDVDMSTDYKHLIDSYKPTIDYGDDWLKTLSHGDIFSDELYHHGIKGQSWGKRRYQFQDGSLTDEGRVHYGVGPAREKLSKAATAVKEAVRKTVNPTSQDLDEKIAKANAKNAAKLEKMQKRDELRAARNAIKDKKLNDKLEEARLKEDRQIKKEYIDKVNGKKKDIDKMSDRELQDELIRLQKERQIRDMDKDLNQGAVGKFMEQYVRTAVGEGLKRGVAEGIGTRLGRAVGGDANKYKLQKEENKLKLDILKGDEVISKNAQKKLYELDNRGKDDFTKQKTSEILSEAQDKLKLAVLLGDDQTSADAAGRLRNYDNSTKNKSYSDKLRDEQDRLKYDVLTGDKQTRKAAADKLRDFDKATEKPKKASIGDKVRDEQDKLKLDVLTGDKKTAKDASKRLQKLTEATSKNNNQKKQQQQQQQKKKKQQQGQNGKS